MVISSEVSGNEPSDDFDIFIFGQIQLTKILSLLYLCHNMKMDEHKYKISLPTRSTTTLHKNSVSTDRYTGQVADHPLEWCSNETGK